MTREQELDECPHCGRTVDGQRRCPNCGQSFAVVDKSPTDDGGNPDDFSTATDRGMSRRKLLTFGGGAAALAGTVGIGLLVVPSEDSEDDQPADDDGQYGFGLVASDPADINTKLDGAVEMNVLSGYEVVDHVGIVDNRNRVTVSVRIRNVGEETPRILAQHSFTAVLYDTDGTELVKFGPAESDNSVIQPTETTVLDYLGPTTNRFESAEIGRYGLILDCAGLDEDNRGPYCPSS